MKPNTEQTEVTSVTTTEQTTTPPVPARIFLRFYENLNTTNSKAPIAHVMLDLPAPLDGTTIEASIFAQRDTRGTVKDIDVVMPGFRGTQSWRAMPTFVKGQDGIAHPIERSADPKGAQLFESLPAKIRGEFYRWQREPKGEFSVTL